MAIHETPPVSLAERAYEQIQQRIAMGELRPGVIVSEAKLARELGISRSPVNVALRQLANDGFVEQIPRYGTVVRSMSRAELIERYELREALETFAASKAAATINHAQLQAVDHLAKAMRRIERQMVSEQIPALQGPLLQQFLAADMAFHALIIQVAGNGQIAGIIKRTRSLTRLFHMQRHVHSRELVDRACHYHEQIVAALQSHDAEACRLAMAEHIRASLRDSLEGFDHQRGGAQGLDALDLPPDLRAELENLFDSRPAADPS